MTTHYLQHPLTKQNLHFGRTRPAALHTRPKRFLSKYVGGTSVQLPPAPLSVDYTRDVGGRFAGLSDVLANDALGDCTAAGACHIVDSFLGRAGLSPALTAAQTVAFYSLSTGYVVGDPSTDQGGDENQVLSTWQQRGLDGSGLHQISAFFDVDPCNRSLMQQIVNLFGNLYFGIELPDAWTANMPASSGFTWDAGSPDPNQGHCVVGLGYSTVGVLIDTWGLVGTMTWAAVEELCQASNGGQLFCVASQEALAGAQKAVPGIDWATMLADAQAEAAASQTA